MNPTNQMPSAEHLLAQAWRCLKEQKINEAIAISQQLNKIYPDLAEGWHFTAQVADAIGNVLAQKQSLKNACKIAPNQVSWKVELANVFHKSLEINSAIQVLDSLDSTKFTALEHNQVAMVYAQINMTAQAIEHYQQAITLEPENNEHYYSLAATQRHAGMLDEAEKNLTKAIKISPDDVDAHTLRVDLRKQTEQHNYIPALTQLLSKELSAKLQVQVYFALAKSYEDLGQYPQSFEYLQQGCRLRRIHINYHIGQDIDTMTYIGQQFDLSWWQNTESISQEKLSEKSQLTPIFIVGMPRTGSTLTDRILSSNEKVFEAGELNDFAQLLTDQVNKQFGREVKTKQQFVKAASKIDFTQLGQDYLQAVGKRISQCENSKHVQYFTDKLPFNFLYLGLIKKALPHAKIIHVTRDPMDTCYAVYKTLFEQAYPFSYDQKELAQYFLSYQKLMEHWQTIPDINFHTVNYEQLVENTEGIGKALYQFCDLQWQNKYAKVENNLSPSTTASASQVRQPIYKSSVHKWRSYQAELSELKSLIEQAGISCD